MGVSRGRENGSACFSDRPCHPSATLHPWCFVPCVGCCGGRCVLLSDPLLTCWLKFSCLWSSHCDAVDSGSDCSGWGCWCSIPGLAQWVRDPVFLQLWCKMQRWLRFSSWPGNFHMPRVWPLKNSPCLKVGLLIAEWAYGKCWSVPWCPLFHPSWSALWLCPVPQGIAPPPPTPPPL